VEAYVEDYDRIRTPWPKSWTDSRISTTGAPTAGIPDPPTGTRTRLPHVVRSRRILHCCFADAPQSEDVLVLQTMRSHDQWNTTIYSDNDRYRGSRIYAR